MTWAQASQQQLKDLVQKVEQGEITSLSFEDLDKAADFAVTQAQRALDLAAAGDYQQAFDLARQNVDLLGPLGDEKYGPTTYARALLMTIAGDILLIADQEENGRRYLEAAAGRYAITLEQPVWASDAQRMRHIPEISRNYGALLMRLAALEHDAGRWQDASQIGIEALVVYQNATLTDRQIEASQQLVDMAVQARERADAEGRDVAGHAISEADLRYRHSLGLQAAGRNREGLEEARIALTLVERYPAAPGSPSTALSARLALAQAHQGLGEHVPALEILEAATKAIDVLPVSARNETLLSILERQTASLLAARRFGEAATVLREQIKVAEDAGHSVLTTAHMRQNLALALHAQGRLAAAEKVLRRARTDLEQLPQDQIDVARLLGRALRNLAVVRKDQNYPDEALTLAREAVALYETVPGGDMGLAEAYVAIMENLILLERPVDAETAREEGLRKLGTGANNVAARERLAGYGRRPSDLVCLKDDTDLSALTDAALSEGARCLAERFNDATDAKRYEDAEAIGVQMLAVLDVQSGRPATDDMSVRLDRTMTYRIRMLESLGAVAALAGRSRAAAEYLFSSMKTSLDHNFPRLLGLDLPQKAGLLRQYIPLGLAETNYSLVIEDASVPRAIGMDTALLTKDTLTWLAMTEHKALFTHGALADPELHGQYLDLRRAFSWELMALKESVYAGRRASDGAASLEQTLQPLSDFETRFGQAVTLDVVETQDVVSHLGPAEGLIEYVLYKSYDKSTGDLSGDYRYGAFVVNGATGRVSAVDLGPARGIDALVADFRQTIQTQIEMFSVDGRAEAELADVSRKLRGGILDPLQPHLAGIGRLFVAPVGSITLVPFEVLPTSQATGPIRYLVEDVGLVYLNSARQLTRRTDYAADGAECVPRPGTTDCQAVLIAAPDFAGSGGGATTQSRSPELGQPKTFGGRETGPEDALSEALIPERWLELPETLTLASRLGHVARAARIPVRELSGPGASEANVLRTQRPKLLLIATHGEFARLPREISMGLQSLRIDAQGTRLDMDWQAVYQQLDPGMNSLLVLAGAERRFDKPPPDDGLLTAFEIRGMDLRGTELVMLAACETGLTDVQIPEGDRLSGLNAAGDTISGLRQSFAIAGAKSTVMSLWQVPEGETIAQTETFATHWLQDGMPRYAAFRKAQLSALQTAKDDQARGGHPFWWGGFVFAGDPGDMATSPAPYFAK
ncbi:MAG: CHAT domain-containing tetratricopeptide repeat protein [Pseudomonadota bacterium]